MKHGLIGIEGKAMKKITVTLDDEVAHWARLQTAEGGISMSRLVEELLREKIREEENYRVAMKRFLSRKPEMLKKVGTSYPKREELYEH